MDVGQIIISGKGIVSPIGIGREAFAASLREGRSGVGPISAFDASGLPVQFGGEVTGFDPKQYVKPRKSLKVMSREIQFAFAAADMACQDAGLTAGSVDPERLGVVFGADLIYCELGEIAPAFRRCIRDGKFDMFRWGNEALREMFPLWMLKYLPNMSACHIGIAHDARGPNNSITLGDVSSLLALAEAVRVIERGRADVMIVGGSSSRLHPMLLVSRGNLQLSHRHDDPAAASRPFDRLRDGMVNGEGAAAFVVESESHARRRGARVLARVLGYSSGFEPRRNGSPAHGAAIRRSLQGALEQAGLAASDIGHVNAHGASTIEQDRLEAQAIHDVLGDVPVTAPKSFFGNLGAGTGAVEMAASLWALETGQVSATLNFQHPDPECPVNVVRCGPAAARAPTAVVANHNTMGQAVAVVLAGPE